MTQLYKNGGSNKLVKRDIHLLKMKKKKVSGSFN